jgi:hypothetical protein
LDQAFDDLDDKVPVQVSGANIPYEMIATREFKAHVVTVIPDPQEKLPRVDV